MHSVSLENIPSIFICPSLKSWNFTPSLIFLSGFLILEVEVTSMDSLDGKPLVS